MAKKKLNAEKLAKNWTPDPYENAWHKPIILL
jgi:hypothetical protein